MIFRFLRHKKIDEWQPLLAKINNWEKEFEKIPDDQLKEKTLEFKTRLSRGESLDDLLPEAFALVREASKRTLKQRHYDVQILGGIGLHRGMIIEMMTGEGKTLVATLPAYLNALTGKGVHIVTVNDYLAKRDTIWMGQIYHLLGLSVSCLVHEASYLYDPSFTEEKAKDKERDTTGSFMVFYEYLKPISRKEAYLADITYGTNHEFGFDYLRDNLEIDENSVVQRDFNYAIIDEVDSILIDEARTPLIISGYEESPAQVYYFWDQVAKSLKKDEDFVIEEKSRAIYLTEEGQNKLEKILNYNPYKVDDLFSIHHLEQALKANYLFFRDKDYVVRNNEIIIVDEFTGRLMFGRRWSGGLHQAIEAKEGCPIQPESKTVAEITIQNLFRKYKKLAGMTGTAITSAEEFYKVYGLEVVVIPPNKPSQRRDHDDKIFLTKEEKWQAVVEKVKELYEKGRPVLVGTTSIANNEYLSKKLKDEDIPHQVLNAKNHEEEGKVIAQAGKLKAVTVATNMAGRGVGILLITKAINEAQAKVEGFNFDLRKHLLEYDDVINAQREKIYAERKAILFNQVDLEKFLAEAIEDFLKEERNFINFILRLKDEDNPEEKLRQHYTYLKENLGEDWLKILKITLLRVYDYLWSEHLTYLAELKESVSWRGYAHRDPLVEYKRGALESFANFHRYLKIYFIQYLYNLEIKRNEPKIGRNDPCPCGSGKKWKKCGLLNTPEHQERMKRLKVNI